MVADLWREDRAAAFDGILNVAQNMGEADLMRPGQILLACIAVGHPDVGSVISKHACGDNGVPGSERPCAALPDPR